MAVNSRIASVAGVIWDIISVISLKEEITDIILLASGPRRASSVYFSDKSFT